MSRRAKARRAQSAEPGDRGAASIERGTENRGSEETLDMSSVMATDMQQGGGPKMKRAPVRAISLSDTYRAARAWVKYNKTVKLFVGSSIRHFPLGNLDAATQPAF